MAQGIVLMACLVLPLALAFFIHRKYHASWWMLGMGILSFTLSQLVLRLPLLSYLQSSAQFYLFTMNTIPYLLFLAITAALFEESGRWLFFRLDRSHHTLENAFLFGIGHGMIEAIVLVLVPMWSQNPTISQACLVSFERLLAISFHICASLWVYQSIKNKKWSYLAFAYVAHFLFNFVPVTLSILIPLMAYNVWLLEGVICFLTIGMIWITKNIIFRRGDIIK